MRYFVITTKPYLVHATCHRSRKPAPDGEKHRDAGELNRPSGLFGPRARERACAVPGRPRCGNAPGLPGNRVACSSRSISKFRACWTVHDPSGCSAWGAGAPAPRPHVAAPAAQRRSTPPNAPAALATHPGDEHQVDHPYHHKHAILPTQRPARLAYSQVNYLCWF